MKPLDPKLLRYAAPARGYVLLTTAFGIVTAGLVIAQALLIAAVLAPVVSSGATLGDVAGHLRWLAAVVVARAVVNGLQERYAHRAATRVVTSLRGQVLEHAAGLGPRWLATGQGVDVVTLATRGLDDLEPYLVRYLPQLLLAVTVTPATLVVVFGLDWISAVIVVVTIPLVPVFMILVGQLTQAYSERRLAVMQRLGSQVLDLLAGLPTLRAFGRERGPVARVRQLGEAYTRSTMKTLRVAFLSGMVLELLTTLSVALVAVGVGLRLVYGQVDLEVAIAVLVLAPEVYLPIRQIGVQFHASTDGITAAQKAFAVIEEPLRPRGTVAAPDLARSTVTLSGVGVVAPGRDVSAPSGLTASIAPGRIVALTGPSGSGKTTTVLALLGLVSPDAGTVQVDGTDLATVDLETWWRQIAWLPQRSALPPGSIRATLDAARRSGAEHQGPRGDTFDPDDTAAGTAAATARAMRLTGLDAVVAALPDGLDTVLGQGGVGLSVGQRQRVALTAALLGDEPLVVLDEPTAHLDALAEDQVLASLAALREAGRTVLVVAHRPSLVALADDVVEVTSSPRTRDEVDA
ncbi:cysteine export CydDC family ABC transporter permease subunit/ATP-binding protein CydD [Sanguibacter keddieii DSM 10542]|uniref:Cysteine export CydDC family ABC transporter permease subunit/ATP-binding protein CydD n=1 Tax=Sanguibacter keddieii (strain ATCC 51767 / DSM 10542 / NCFB 3025 / ST-74) TaxID=446469 RepID=D1BDL8_SANKS|nr:thiol reductant ABC exporter subunit CydD [Sanguibacter keddieii]ACZ21080.1 cysteine export CydDC family ABC transporter permease subunit/ATP-binding protein CydD [Sanguibacter keddieii DSM 10542]